MNLRTENKKGIKVILNWVGNMENVNDIVLLSWKSNIIEKLSSAISFFCGYVLYTSTNTFPSGGCTSKKNVRLM